MTRHIGERTLARFGQGDLSMRRSVRIRAHLTRCARCRELNEDLAAVTTLLAGVQAPPMPEHLSARIQTALAAEAARRAAPTAVASDAGAETARAGAPDAPASRSGVRSARPARPAHERRRPRAFRLSSPVVLRTMAATAAAVVLASGGYEIATHVGGSRGPGPTVSGPESAPAINRHLAAPDSGAAAAPQLHYEYAGRQDIVTAVASGRNYEPATLGAQVGQELKQKASSAGRAGASSLRSNASYAPTAGSAPTVGGLPVGMLQGCISRLVPGERVLLVDVARYQGGRATVIVTRASASGPEQVWVVGPGCSNTRSDLLSHVTLAAAG
jgi:hypothetical protein